MIMNTKVGSVRNTWSGALIAIALLFSACTNNTESEETSLLLENEVGYVVEVLAKDLHDASTSTIKSQAETEETVLIDAENWIAIAADFEEAGRYQVQVVAKNAAESSSLVWLEDYYDNPDDRNYDVTGKISFSNRDAFEVSGVDGSPFNKGKHNMKLHVSEGAVHIEKVIFTLMMPHSASEKILEQATSGETWTLVWSDEFDGDTIDESKWTYDFGDWGWGNNELQYYTASRSENARIEDGHLIIEARKDDFDKAWTSARLTTRGKVAFLYGKIEFKAKVPSLKGNWAAGWTLGNTYVDEKDWPYCGEIDILESVGYEVDNETGDGIAHATVHTPAYYFKINNQISSQKAIPNMASEFHTYAVEWTPTEIKMLVNDEVYYTYDKNANEKEWPFHIPQNIILNLAIGGGWGGSQGLDPEMISQEFILDYVRVYEKR